MGQVYAHLVRIKMNTDFFLKKVNHFLKKNYEFSNCCLQTLSSMKVKKVDPEGA